MSEERIKRPADRREIEAVEKSEPERPAPEATQDAFGNFNRALVDFGESLKKAFDGFVKTDFTKYGGPFE